MLPLIETLLSSRTVYDEKGEAFPLHSNTSLAQCAFLQSLIRRCDASTCIEIGLAYGISSLAICEAIQTKDRGLLISIDPHQGAAWRDIGRLNLARAGFADKVEFYDRPSFEALPKLWSEGVRVGFAYVDSVKVFDMLLIDAFYLTRMLDIGGIIVFDDCDWPGVRMLVRYLASMPHLRVAATIGESPKTFRRRVVSSTVSFVPGKRKIFRSDLATTDQDLGIAGSCVAFEKIQDDERNWDWFSPQ